MKKKIIKASLLGTSSIIGTLISCDNNNINGINRVYDEPIMSRDAKTRSIAIPLSESDDKYLSIIQKIADDIYKYPQLACDFAENPQQYFSKYGYSGEINLDDGYLRFLTAYADSEIREAISNKDLKLVIKLCREKKIFDNATSKVGLVDKFKQVLEEKGYDSQVQPYGWLWMVEWIAVASAYAGVQAAYNFSAYTDVSTEGIMASLSNNQSGVDIKLLWNIIADEEPVRFITLDNYKGIANEIFITLKETRPDLFRKFTEKDILNQITASLYGIIL